MRPKRSVTSASLSSSSIRATPSPCSRIASFKRWSSSTMRRSSSLSCGRSRLAECDCSRRCEISKMRRSISASGRMSGPCATRVESCSTAERRAVTSCEDVAASSMRPLSLSISERKRWISAGLPLLETNEVWASRSKPKMRCSIMRSSSWLACTA